MGKFLKLKVVNLTFDLILHLNKILELFEEFFGVSGIFQGYSGFFSSFNHDKELDLAKLA